MTHGTETWLVILVSILSVLIAISLITIAVILISINRLLRKVHHLSDISYETVVLLKEQLSKKLNLVRIFRILARRF